MSKDPSPSSPAKTALHSLELELSKAGLKVTADTLPSVPSITINPQTHQESEHPWKLRVGKERGQRGQDIFAMLGKRPVKQDNAPNMLLYTNNLDAGMNEFGPFNKLQHADLVIPFKNL